MAHDAFLQHVDPVAGELMGIAERKWLAVFLDLASYELSHWSDGEMLSDATHRWVDRNGIAARVFIISAGALITAHLARVIDPKFDVLSKECYLRTRPVKTSVIKPGWKPAVLGSRYRARVVAPAG